MNNIVNIYTTFALYFHNIDMEKNKTKRERFEIVGGKRIQYILNKLESLGNCANTNNYEYNEKDVKKMFSAIKEKLKLIETRFNNELSKKSRNTFKF